MPTRTHEQTINTALGELLHPLGRTWKIRSENIGRIFEEGGRPDVLIEKADGWPIVIGAAEPQVHANKQTRLVFSGEDEVSERRTDPRS